MGDSNSSILGDGGSDYGLSIYGWRSCRYWSPRLALWLV